MTRAPQEPQFTPPDAPWAGGRLALLSQLRAAARAITLPLFSSGMRVENKARGGVNFDPVTNADIGAERALRDLIIKHFPDDGIEGEELEDIDGRTDWSWTLDPIDGTRGFVAGVPVWSTLIAISYKDIPVIGMMDFPALGQTYQGISYEDQSCAWRALDSGGLFSIHSRPCAAISDAVLGCTEPLAMLGPGELAAYNIIRRGARFSRLGLDAYGYALAASGRMDIIIEAGLKPCDVRALMPVMKGAGGAMTNWHGGTAAGGGRAVAVGDPGLLPELYTYLGRAMQP